MQSLRSRWIVASVLWTCGLLMLIHMLSLALMHAFPAMRRLSMVSVIVAALMLMAAGFMAARRSLATFQPLRERLLAVRRGEAARVEGVYPSEVRPLIEDLNALLAEREQAVERAQRTAADLAHELKTPLALLMQESERAAGEGNTELAASIGQQAERMSRQVNYHLARARAAASGTRGAAPCALSPCAEALLRTMAKLYSGRALTFRASVAAEIQVRVRREDLDEMLGNLLDNACKWSGGQVVLSAVKHGAMVEIAVEDDGPGLAPELRMKVLERGVRADQSAPGSGLGLAIVRDLAELYGGGVALEGAELGGLRARLTLPVV
ncbi:MAG: HAMP domain-containing sensor histidine kinase [Bryobacteraceae bacterium]